MIVVIGATGTTGSHLIDLLTARGEAVRAVSRDPSRSSGTDGVHWVQADLTDREATKRACAGGTALFLATGNDERMVRLQKNAIRAARDAGVARIVKLSALGASDHSKSIIGTWHYAVEHVLFHAGGDWTILRPHVFMQNLLAQRESIRSAGEIRSPAGDGAIPFIDTRDIADVAAVVLTTQGHAGETYTLTGGLAMTYGDVAATLSTVLGRPVAYRRETLDEAWARLRREGMPTWHAAAQLALAEYQRAGGPTARTTDTVERLTGRAPRTLETFVRDHVDDFRGG